jgi:hypothetical protein
MAMLFDRWKRNAIASLPDWLLMEKDTTHTSDFDMSCPVITYSHRLSASAFALFADDDLGISVTDITERQFFMRCRSLTSGKMPMDFAYAAHRAMSCLLMAINVASVGHFVWTRNDEDTFPQYALLDRRQSQLSVVHHKRDLLYPPEAIRDLTPADVQRTGLLFGAIASDPKLHHVHEYLRGIYHMGLQIYDLDFRKDGFANFYRVLEYCVAERVLKIPKLTNELRDIQRAIRQLGFGENMAETFKKMYIVRSEQVAHAQRDQKELDWETVATMKAFTDGILNKVYESVWDELAKSVDNDEAP